MYLRGDLREEERPGLKDLDDLPRLVRDDLTRVNKKKFLHKPRGGNVKSAG